MSGHGHDVPHHAENHEQKKIGIFISVVAVIMAVVTSLANNQSNEMIIKQVEASNGFSWYQSKRQRSYMNELEIARIDREMAGAPTDAQRKLLEETRSRLKAKNSEYEKENEKIRSDSEGDRQAAELAAHRHHQFEFAEVALHIAVVLCSLTLLTEMRLFYQIGITATLLGVALAGYGFLIKPHAHDSGSDAHPAAVAPAASHDKPH
ncbi:MAG TPA: hypothetical protein DCM86_20550 [Verrucomicrobiales bacterium]|nr:hypothetical protein [Verrucomicrobiales bacterium]